MEKLQITNCESSNSTFRYDEKRDLNFELKSLSLHQKTYPKKEKRRKR